MKSDFAKLCLIVLVLSACSPGPEELLVGRWNCFQKIDGGEGEAKILYLDDGRFEVSFSGNFVRESDGLPTEFKGVSRGTWKVANDNLTTTTDYAGITSLTIDGASVRDQAVFDDFKENLKGSADQAEILSLDERTLSYKTSNGVETCSRAP
jgi:hypothetical protein